MKCGGVEGQPQSQIGPETQTELKVSLPLSVALEIINNSPLLAHQKSKIAERFTDAAEPTELAALEALETSLGIEQEEIENLSPEERGELVVTRVGNLMEIIAEFETSLGIDAEETKRLFPDGKVKLIGERLVALTVRAVLEGLLDVSFARLSPQEQQRIESGLAKWNLPAINPTEVNFI